VQIRICGWRGEQLQRPAPGKVVFTSTVGAKQWHTVPYIHSFNEKIMMEKHREVEARSQN